MRLDRDTRRLRQAQVKGRRRLDWASLVLLLVGLWCGYLSYWLITEHGYSPLLLVPSVVASTVGASHLTKRQAPRRRNGGPYAKAGS